MKVLLDENLPHQLRHELAGHDARTVSFMKWTGVRNGTLLARAAAGGFDALITLDAGIEHEKDIARLPIAVVILHAASNAIEDPRPLVPQLLAVLGTLAPKSIEHVR